MKQYMHKEGIWKGHYKRQGAVYPAFKKGTNLWTSKFQHLIIPSLKGTLWDFASNPHNPRYSEIANGMGSLPILNQSQMESLHCLFSINRDYRILNRINREIMGASQQTTATKPNSNTNRFIKDTHIQSNHTEQNQPRIHVQTVKKLAKCPEFNNSRRESST